jgi:small-conductance mechanosensitive channel
VLAFEFTDAWRNAAVHAASIVLIVVVAVIANALIRRAIRKTTDKMQYAALEVRDRAPSALVRAETAQRSAARAQALSTVLSSLSTLVIATIAVFMILGELSINLAPLIAGAGIASIAVGFGAQSLVKDVLNGMFIMMEDQFGVGDTVDLGVASGQVEHITLRTTRLRDVAGTVWHVPNGQILEVGNKSQNWARAVIDIVVAADADLRVARETMRRVADEVAVDPEWSQRISGAPDEQGVQALTPEGVTLRLMVETEPASQWAVERELRMRIKEALDAAGVPLATVPGRPPGAVA